MAHTYELHINNLNEIMWLLWSVSHDKKAEKE